MNYSLYFKRAAEQLIEIEIETVATGKPQIFRLPKWRPGRYELQRFDKLLSDFQVKNIQNENIPFQKLSTHTWQVVAKAGETLRLSYVFYATQRDSGGSSFDANGIYVNPCNLLLYQEETINDPCTMTLHIPDTYEIACGLPRVDKLLAAKNFHELADSPFFAAPDLQHHEFDVRDLHIHLWFWGDCKPDFERFETDIRGYTEAQFKVFGDCPVPEYHYLCQILPYKFRHGVEHQTASVNTYGPGYSMMQKERYEPFIELLSHEFFHTWNVKYLRPADMYPYNYGAENFSALHYVTEGVTSYYGDLMLLKGGVYSLERFLQNLNAELIEHHAMPGKDYISLEQASFNSWTNGYGVDTGIPNRKISFYTKGYIVSFLLDYEIRKNSENQYSLDDVLREMYQSIAKNEKGYTKEDFQTICEHFAGKKMPGFFEKFIENTDSLDEELKKAGKYFGLALKYGKLAAIPESLWGLKMNGNIIEGIVPSSPALQAGLSKGDEIVAINSKKMASAPEIWAYLQAEKSIEVHYFHFEQLKQTTLTQAESYQPQIPFYALSPFPAEDVEGNVSAWVGESTLVLD